MPKPADPTTGFALKYDAWNRLVEVKDGANVVATMEYDGLARRIQKVVGGDTYDYYYNEDWQLLEERKNGSSNPLQQFVWHPYYIDALAVRYYDADTDGILNENNDGRHYYLQDANYNVTAVVNASGTVLERYSYSPYGEVTFLDSSFVIRASSLIANTHLYTGRERDPETGLQLNRERFYASHIGRWVNRDPIGYEGSEWNLYEYAVDNPLKNTDAWGQDAGGRLPPGPIPPEIPEWWWDSPGPEWEWKGPKPGGSWVRPGWPRGESLRPAPTDPNHLPHWDWKDSWGNRWRYYPQLPEGERWEPKEGNDPRKLQPQFPPKKPRPSPCFRVFGWDIYPILS